MTDFKQKQTVMNEERRKMESPEIRRYWRQWSSLLVDDTMYKKTSDEKVS